MKTITAVSGEWFNRDEAMSFLKVSQSTLERMVASGEVETKLEPMEGRRPLRLYLKADLDKAALVAAEREKRTQARAMASRPAQLPSLQLPAPAPEPEPKREREALWVSVEEAAAILDFSEAFVLTQVLAGKIDGLKAGPNGTWRVRRGCLADFRP